ncbi:sel1 repeat family protein [Vibrio hepatarius]|uniref:sel1 repeat family protein n=1 Tax=Vibrio hepatarius TaxID=171383 RepID=UPI00142E7882|nr:sel1 repeat family protein [Vibrio hepatarius]NIY84074.1 sel1 repeat family protein [Vibrio hepatarius]
MKKILFILLLFAQHTVWAQSPTEQGILLFNQKEYQKAEEILQQQSNDGSAYATFWLGVVQYKSRKHFQAGDTFLKAARMGDPWAMGVLAGGKLYANTPCNYLGWPCDNKWEPKAQQGWAKLAQQSDGKAAFALNITKREWWEYIPFYRQSRYKDIISNAVPNGGYKFLDYNTYWDSSDEKLPYLRLAAEQGYAPAMQTLYYHMITVNLDEARKWINEAIQLGYPEAARTLYLSYFLGEKDSNGNVVIQSDPKKAYYYNRLSGALGGEESDNGTIVHRRAIENGLPISDQNGDPVFEILVTEQEQAEMDKQVAEFVKDIKPNMFLDETSIDLF